MAHVAIEVVIMVPVLVAQILLFPLVANTMTTYWQNASREITLQEVASQMGSTIQQLYLYLSRMEVSAGTITYASTFPTTIASHIYTARGSLRTSVDLNSSKILLLTLTLQDVGTTVTVQVSLGPNVSWVEESIFYSYSPNASIKVQKFANRTLLFSFG